MNALAPVRIIIAPASFKGSLSAPEACDAMATGVRDALANATIDRCPIGDGGEGTAEILARSCARFEDRWSRTVDPLGRPIDARWFIVHEPGTRSAFLSPGAAIVDAASCLGLSLLEKGELDPERASSAGLGILIRAIAEETVSRIVIGLGGTATMDCGIGLAGALGWRFFDAPDKELDPTPNNLARIAAAQPTAEPLDVEIVALCDVRAPVTGPTGAARVFAPQKGATPAQVDRLDAAMASFAQAVGRADPNEPGAGAAGGLGWALRAFAGATVHPGAPTVLDAVGFDERARAGDLILTGEGRLDGQTGMGKAIAEVCAIAREAQKPVIAIVGRIDGDREAIAASLGLAEIVALSAGDSDDARAMAEVRERLRTAAARVAEEVLGRA